MPIKGLIDKKTKYKDLTKNRTVLYVTVVPFWYSRSFDDACFFFFTLVVVLFITSLAICLLTVRILLTEKPGLKLNCFLKKKLDRFEGEQIKYAWVFPQIQLLNRPQSIWGNETRIYSKCMDHQITAWARWPNISAYKMYFPTNLYLGQPLRWR